jgi:AraC family transcriptional regulator of adaptative response / DNA-3-methyladenine glycosylase II
LRVRGAPPTSVMAIAARARQVFDLSADPLAVASTLHRDPLLASLVRRRPGLRIPGAWDPFECAVRAILGQQVTVAAGRTLVRRLVDRLGTRVAAADAGPTHLFPAPQVIAGGDLDGLGVMPARVRALRALASAVAEGRLDFTHAPEDVLRTIAALPGCGEWTAQYVALRALHAPDAFLAGDIVLRRIVSPDRAPLTARALVARAEAWRPWRAYAVLHLWAAAHSYRNMTVR